MENRLSPAFSAIFAGLDECLKEIQAFEAELKQKPDVFFCGFIYFPMLIDAILACTGSLDFSSTGLLFIDICIQVTLKRIIIQMNIEVTV